MSKKILKYIEQLPIICFAAGYFGWGIFGATVGIIGATVITFFASWAIERKPRMRHLVLLVIVVLFGGSTLVFQDPLFIKVKATFIYALFAVALFISAARGGNMIRKTLEEAIPNPNFPWAAFAFRAGILCLVLSLANEIVWRSQPESFWVIWKIASPFVIGALFFIFHFRWLMPPTDKT